jgi:hypothetical protein
MAQLSKVRGLRMSKLETCPTYELDVSAEVSNPMRGFSFRAGLADLLIGHAPRSNYY